MVKRKNNKSAWSNWLFTLGWLIPVVIALATTFLSRATWAESIWWYFALVILGLLVGYSFKKDQWDFLTMTLVLALLITFAPVAEVPIIGPLVNTFLTTFLAFLSPAAFVMLWRQFYNMLS